MIIKGSVGRAKKECLSKYCEKLDLKAQYVFETGVLSFIFGVLAHGGTIVMTKANGDKCEYEAPGCLKDSPTTPEKGPQS
jgi:hypothetical protein